MTRLATVPPAPRGAPVLGSALDLRRDVLGTYERARRAYGDVVRFVIGPPGVGATMYALFHPDAVRRVLAGEADRYQKDNRFYREVRWALGEGLLGSQDETWLRQRRFIQPLFTRRRIAGYARSMAEEAGDLTHRWRELSTIDLHAEMSRVTLRVVGRLLFGSDLERAVAVVGRAFPVLGEYARRRAFAPLRVPHGGPTPAGRRTLRARRDVYRICDELIADRRASDGGGDDLLGLHRDAQRRVRDEVDAVLGDRAPTAGDVEALTYTTMVLKEAMRLYPPAWGLGRRTAGGDSIDGYEIPPGSDVAVSAWVTHRHPGFWDEPERFDPERFTPESESQRHRHAYFPFGAGPRACIGQYFSMLEGRDRAGRDRPELRARLDPRARLAGPEDHPAPRRAGALPAHPALFWLASVGAGYARPVAGRPRVFAFGLAVVAVAAGVVCAASVSGVTGQAVAIALISLGLGGALLLAFLEVGLSEDRERARDDERRRRRAAGSADAHRRLPLRRGRRRRG
jgi:cytochrome P450